MSEFSLHIVSTRLLFLKTFEKLVGVLDSEVSCFQYSDVQDVYGNLPTAKSGALILDGATMCEDQVTDTLLNVLDHQAEAALIVVVDEQDDRVVNAAMDLGAAGVIIKASPPQVIIDSLQRILSGERCRPAPVVDVASDAISEDMRGQLSARQQKMLRAIMGGHSITATARLLSITPSKLVTEMRQVIATIRGKVL